MNCIRRVCRPETFDYYLSAFQLTSVRLARAGVGQLGTDNRMVRNPHLIARKSEGLIVRRRGRCRGRYWRRHSRCHAAVISPEMIMIMIMIASSNRSPLR